MRRNFGHIKEQRTRPSNKVGNQSGGGVSDIYDAAQYSLDASWPWAKKFTNIIPSTTTASENVQMTVGVNVRNFLDGEPIYYQVVTTAGPTMTDADFLGIVVSGGSFTNSATGTMGYVSVPFTPIGDGLAESNSFKIQLLEYAGGPVAQKWDGTGDCETPVISVADAAVAWQWHYGSSDTDADYCGTYANTYLEYKGTFTGNQNVPFTNMSAWQAMMDNVPSTATDIKFYDSTFSSTSPAKTMSTSTHVNGLCNAMRNGTTYSGGTWWIQLSCVNTGVWNTFVNSYSGRTGGTTNDSTSASYARYIGATGSNSCTCSVPSNGFVLRPHIGNRNWGGWQIGCSASTRHMKLRVTL